MSDILETVIIKSENGPIRINKRDFKDGVHELHDEGMFTPSQPAPVMGATGSGTILPNANAQGETPQLGVIRKKKLFFVADPTTGNEINIPGIDPAGYPSNEAAWAAIFALNKPPETPAA